jgi:replicative superfamily II helicase
MLTFLHELAKVWDETTGEFDLDLFKIVFITPMKALIQEMVGSFFHNMVYVYLNSLDIINSPNN